MRIPSIMYYCDSVYSPIGCNDSHFTALNTLKPVALGSIMFLIRTVTSALHFCRQWNVFSNMCEINKLSNNTCRCTQVYTCMRDGL